MVALQLPSGTYIPSRFILYIPPAAANPTEKGCDDYFIALMSSWRQVLSWRTDAGIREPGSLNRDPRGEQACLTHVFQQPLVLKVLIAAVMILGCF